jgi:hypothetical protein
MPSGYAEADRPTFNDVAAAAHTHRSEGSKRGNVPEHGRVVAPETQLAVAASMNQEVGD